MTAGQFSKRVDEAAENPYLRFVARTTMIIVTLVAAPYVYWLTSTMLTTTNTVGSIVLIQTQQQSQITTLTQAQAKILDVQASESLSRSTQDAILATAIDALKEKTASNAARLDRQDDRINQLYQNRAGH